MTEAEWAALRRYLRARADELGLRDWTLEVERTKPDDEEAFAEVRAIEGRKVARIRVCPDFRQLHADDQRHTLIHELLHCHLAPVLMTADHLDVALSHPQWQQHKAALNLAVEYACDGIAAAIAELYERIDWTSSDEAPA